MQTNPIICGHAHTHTPKSLRLCLFALIFCLKCWHAPLPLYKTDTRICTYMGMWLCFNFIWQINIIVCHLELRHCSVITYACVCAYLALWITAVAVVRIKKYFKTEGVKILHKSAQFTCFSSFGCCRCDDSKITILYIKLKKIIIFIQSNSMHFDILICGFDFSTVISV